MKVITATSGKVLREYVNCSFKDTRNKRVVVFPEAGLDANEQDAFVLDNERNYQAVH